VHGGGAGSNRPFLRTIALAFALVGFAASGCGGAQRPTLAKAPSTPTVQAPAPQPRGESIVATALRHSVAVYHSMHAKAPYLHLSNPTASGAPLVFLVKHREGGWEQVYLPVRPNDSTGWVRDADVSLARNEYSLQVRLREHQLVLRKNARIVQRIRAAVGRSVLPTPTGRYYIVELLKQPDPTGPYGPYAFGLSAFSNVLYSFGGGPGQIGIHGTNVASSIGHSKSHGCIRISNAAITRLAKQLPLGTPVTIGS